MRTREMQLVRSADRMDAGNFSLHFTRRHADSLAGMSYLSDDLPEDLEDAYRYFHDRLHRLRTDLEHEHSA
jgi:hypothetical protein